MEAGNVPGSGVLLEQEWLGMLKELGPEQGGWDSKRGDHSDEKNVRVMQDLERRVENGG